MSVSPNDLLGSDASTCWGSEVSEDIDDVSDDAVETLIGS